MATVSRALSRCSRPRSRPCIGIRLPVSRTLQGLSRATRSSSDSTSSPCTSSLLGSSTLSTPSSKLWYSSFHWIRKHRTAEPLQDPAKHKELRVVQPWEAQLKNKDLSSKPYWRSVRINGISLTTTLPDIINAIAKYGPFEKIASAEMRPSNDPSTREAVVTFTRESGARELSRFAATNQFEINGVQPFVRQNMNQPMRQEVNRNFSRVLQLIGDRSVPDFHEPALRNILRRSRHLVDKIHKSPAVYVWGFESMPSTYSIRPDGKKVMLWPFFDIELQAIPFMLVLRKHFKKQLLITFGSDPCGKGSVQPREQ